jgi:hypothetical protein
MADIPPIVGSVIGTIVAAINTTIGLINGKFNSRPYPWANAAARLAQTGMTIGEYGYQADTQVTYRATSSTATVPWSSPWITYTPTLTGITLGTAGTNTAKYKYVAGEVLNKGAIKLGTSGMAMGTSPTMTIPIARAALTHNFQRFNGTVDIYDVSATTPYNGALFASSASTTVALIGTMAASIGTVSSTVPMTWAATDEINYEFLYEPA